VKFLLMTRVILPPAPHVTRKCPEHIRATAERLQGQAHLMRVCFATAEGYSITVDIHRSLEEIGECTAVALRCAEGIRA
jgi:hypothetical protein